ncbi:FecR domain-containing protein [Pelagicoccus sp. SDUM812005]|uniref:FecR family protein n=1 Tax=Pelagicoccus sp. SDUM812005 TaxID=3041257 RepID=UPI00280FA54A|nr:FecR domain-containing protein [Pelagicoccus sp. SDUM812005]MDQ8181138.1 FecR domain-containing protein [Pelagicoccus sp. SDUM812005]
MNEKDSDSEDLDRISDVAASWVAKEQKGFSAEEQDGFFQWLAEDRRHGERYAHYKKGWKAFDLLSEWRPEHSSDPNPDLLDSVSPRRWWIPLSAGAVAVAAALALFILVSTYNSPAKGPARGVEELHIVAQDYVHQVLSDGSEIDMREGAAVSIEFGDAARFVRLLEGEVHFTVSKDPDWPFIVGVGDREVRAIGTAFNLKIDSGQLEVLVTEGKISLENVAVEPESLPFVSAPEKGVVEDAPRKGAKGSVLAYMSYGQKSTVSLKSDRDEKPILQNLEAVEIASILDWKHELWKFDGVPLAEIVARFNQRNETKLHLADGSLAHLPIVASIRSNEVESLVRLLDLSLNIEVERKSNGSIWLREK